MEKINNVAQLIKHLNKIPDKENTAVILEGCDCHGNWNGNSEVVEKDWYEPYKKYLLLKRNE